MKKVITTFALASIMILGTTFAHGGIIIAGKPQSDKTDSCQVERQGIIIAGLTGIIIAGFTGIIIAGAPEKDDTGCFEPTVDRDGIIIAG